VSSAPLSRILSDLRAALDVVALASSGGADRALAHIAAAVPRYPDGPDRWRLQGMAASLRDGVGQVKVVVLAAWLSWLTREIEVAKVREGGR
jgi:hypothetical protein